MSDIEIYEKKKVCDVHFMLEHHNRNKRLNALAVPSLYLPQIPHVSQGQMETDQWDILPSTSMSTCPSAGVKQPLHGFPNPAKERERFNQWLYAVDGGLENEHNFKYRRVCRRHFENKYLCRCNKISNIAVPTLHIPGIIKSAHDSDFCQASKSLLPSIDVTLSRNSADHDYLPAPVQTAPAPPPTPPSALPASPPSILIEDCSDDVMVLNLGDWPPLVTTDSANKRNSGPPKKQKQTLRKKKVLRRKELRTNFSERLCRAKRVFNNAGFLHALRKAPNLGKIYKRQRYSLHEKIKCLPLYNKNPKMYTLLYKKFVLPPSKTLKKLLNRVIIRPGIHKGIFEKLKRTVSEMSIKSRLCTLMFNVIKIKPKMHYNAHTDDLQGYVTCGTDNKLADRVIVFMVKGIVDDYKQPVAYYYTQALKKNDLKRMIVEVIGNVQKAGLRVVCTVCDTSEVNVRTINSLIEDTKQHYIEMKKEWTYDLFEVNNRKIIHIYDVPHLMIKIRNTLVDNDIHYDRNGDQNLKTLKWGYFKMLYEIDKRRGELRFLHKITEDHVNTNKSKKVSHAAQLFSRQVAVIANAFVTEYGPEFANLGKLFSQMIPFVLTMDELFDSFNSSSVDAPDHKIYRGCVKRNSIHKKFWEETKTFLENVTYVCKERIGDKILIYERYLPAARYFINNIDAMMSICEVLHNEYRVDRVWTRNFNMEPLANFFADIRRLSARSSVPDCVSFERAYKLLLLNDYKVPFSFGDGRKFSNCEEDHNVCLQKLDFFFTANNRNIRCKDFIDDGDNREQFYINQYIEAFSEMFDEDYYDWEQRHYVCDLYLSKFLKRVEKSCLNCRKTLFSKGSDKWPSQDLAKCFFDIHLLIEEMLKENLFRHKVKDKVKSVAAIYVQYPFDCEVHRNGLKSHFLDTTINIALYCWCRSVNRILAGKYIYEGDDKLKTAAQYYHYRHL